MTASISQFANSQRERVPLEWQHDESFSAVVHLTPAEMGELSASVRRLLARYQDRDTRPHTRPADAVPVAAVTRLFPLLAEGYLDEAGTAAQ